MKNLCKFIATLLLPSFMACGAFAQTGQLQSGQIWGNPAATQKQATGTTVGAILDQQLTCNARGDIIFRGVTLWQCLAPGTSGKALVSAGAGADLSYGTVVVAGGGTGQTTAPLARASSALNIDSYTTHGDSIYTILTTDRVVGTSAAFTASRAWTLPAANAVNAGQALVIADFAGGVAGANTLVITRAGADTINGGTTATISATYGGYYLVSDGTSKWTAQAVGAAASGGVTSVTAGTGLAGGTITTSGTLTADASYFHGYLSGLILSTAGSSATFGVAVGVAVDSTRVAMLKLASAYTKTTSAWALGTATGSLDTGAIANSTWYHVYLIQRTDTGVVDVLISLSATAPTMPTNYTLFRRIGSMKTNGSAQWTLFSQVGDEFLWDVNILDVNVAPGDTTAHSVTLTVPTGVKVLAKIGSTGTNGSGDGRLVLSSLDQSDQAASTTTINVGFAQSGATSGQSWNALSVRTNTSAQIRYRNINAGTTTFVNTTGWVDSRGRLE